MLHATVRRITSLFDDVQITLLKPHPAFEKTYDGAHIRSLERKKREDWHLQRPIWNLLDEKMPEAVDHLAVRWPEIKNKITRMKMRLAGYDEGAR